MPVAARNQDGYNVQIRFVKQLTQETNKCLAAWEMWIPAEEKPDLGSRVKNLQLMNNKLEAKKAMFAIAQRVAKEEKSARMAAASVSAAAASQATAQTTPIVRIKPTSLPRFDGCKREFYQWKRDWESLQKQGEPTGSVEVKKKPKRKLERKFASTRSTKKEGCVVCGDERHREKVFFRKRFEELKLAEK